MTITRTRYSHLNPLLKAGHEVITPAQLRVLYAVQCIRLVKGRCSIRDVCKFLNFSSPHGVHQLVKKLRLSVPFLLKTSLICGTIQNSYDHYNNPNSFQTYNSNLGLTEPNSNGGNDYQLIWLKTSLFKQTSLVKNIPNLRYNSNKDQSNSNRPYVKNIPNLRYNSNR